MITLGVDIGIAAAAMPAWSVTTVTAERLNPCWAQADTGSVSAKAVTSPSGVDRALRSRQCAAEADTKPQRAWNIAALIRELDVWAAVGNTARVNSPASAHP